VFLRFGGKKIRLKNSHEITKSQNPTKQLSVNLVFLSFGGKESEVLNTATKAPSHKIPQKSFSENLLFLRFGGKMELHLF